MIISSKKKKKGETNIQIVEVINNGKCFWVEKCSDLLVASPNASFFLFFLFLKKGLHTPREQRNVFGLQGG